MHIVIEGYRYPRDTVNRCLWDRAKQCKDGSIILEYVGYYYNPKLEGGDCVFFLPKVLLKDVYFDAHGNRVEKSDPAGCSEELVFGEFKPEDILHLETSKLNEGQKRFIREFAVWVYRALVVYQKRCQKLGHDAGIVNEKDSTHVGRGKIRLSNTFLDILLELLRFNRANRNFFIFVAKNMHSGMNRINWTRTISKCEAVLNEQEPVYLNPINVKRTVNFDEELLVIFYSILQYVDKTFGFSAPIPLNYELIPEKKFERYLKGYGRLRLRQIKYKYFSDLSLQLWELCYAFFDQMHRVKISSAEEEYLLARDFHIVFEDMIDELLGDKPGEYPDELKNQEDGKIVDHLYRDESLTRTENDGDVFYIGDSKYYKIGADVSRESVYKQFTYAKNLVQWNLNLFLDEDEAKNKAVRQKFKWIRPLVDPVTEGYDVVPNFFISAFLDLNEKNVPVRDRKFKRKERVPHYSRQFENRLFDRDTLLVAHYDVNFLLVLSLYASENGAHKLAWQREMRKEFKSVIRKELQERFDFEVLTPKAGIEPKRFFKDELSTVLGKVYSPYPELGGHTYYALALEKDNGNAKLKAANAHVREKLAKGFVIKPCELGKDPSASFAAGDYGSVGIDAVVSSLLPITLQPKGYKEALDRSKGKCPWILPSERHPEDVRVILLGSPQHVHLMRVKAGSAPSGPYTVAQIRELLPEFAKPRKIGKSYLSNGVELGEGVYYIWEIEGERQVYEMRTKCRHCRSGSCESGYLHSLRRKDVHHDDAKHDERMIEHVI